MKMSNFGLRRIPLITGPLYPQQERGQSFTQWLESYLQSLGDRPKGIILRECAGLAGILVGIFAPTTGWHWALRAPTSVAAAMVAFVFLCAPSIWAAWANTSTTSGAVFHGQLLVLALLIILAYPLLLAPHGIASLAWRAPAALGLSAITLLVWLTIAAPLVHSASEVATAKVSAFGSERSNIHSIDLLKRAQDTLQSQDKLNKLLNELNESMDRPANNISAGGDELISALQKHPAVADELARRGTLLSQHGFEAIQTGLLGIVTSNKNIQLGRSTKSKQFSAEIGRVVIFLLSILLTVGLTTSAIAAATTTPATAGTLVVYLALVVTTFNLALHHPRATQLYSTLEERYPTVLVVQAPGWKTGFDNVLKGAGDPRGCKRLIHHPVWDTLSLDAYPNILSICGDPIQPFARNNF